MDTIQSTKTCTLCGEIKPLPEFYRHKRMHDGHSARCKVCVSRSKRAFRLLNIEAERARERSWKTRNKERHLETNRKWNEANRERANTYKRAYRARKRGAEGSHTVADVRRKFAEQQGRCYWCGVILQDSYHVDHIFPLSKGGSDWPENICCSCPMCNQTKRDLDPQEFSGRLF